MVVVMGAAADLVVLTLAITALLAAVVLGDIPVTGAALIQAAALVLRVKQDKAVVVAPVEVII
jgi:hypothetical protein